MSQGFIVGKGGGMNKGAVKKGTIVVTYPEGSICTVTNGSKTFAALDTNGAAAFVIDPGEWTVTAAQGSDTATEVVTVTAGGWVEVELDYLCPAEYQPVEYLQGTGSQYIKTGLSIPGSYFRAEGQFMFPSTGVSWGSVEGYKYISPYMFQANNSTIDIEGGEATFVTFSSSLNTILNYAIEVNGSSGSAAINGTTKSGSVKLPLSKAEMHIFGRNSAGNKDNPGGKVWRTKWYFSEGVPAADFVPCYRKSDGVAGLYDRVGKRFLTNAGSGTFIVGADL